MPQIVIYIFNFFISISHLPDGSACWFKWKLFRYVQQLNTSGLAAMYTWPLSILQCTASRSHWCTVRWSRDDVVLQATLNQSLLQSEDLMKAATATMNKEKPIFAKLWLMQCFTASQCFNWVMRPAWFWAVNEYCHETHIPVMCAWRVFIIQLWLIVFYTVYGIQH